MYVTTPPAGSRLSCTGNILVIAALIALQPNDLNTPLGVAYVVGTALSTIIAHIVAESVGASVRNDTPPPASRVRSESRSAIPIASSATVPALLMITALVGWLDNTTALLLAIGVTVLPWPHWVGWSVESAGNPPHHAPSWQASGLPWSV